MEEIQNYKFFSDLKLLPFVDRILVYGSRARGDNQARSDIDIAIDCPQATSSDWLKVVDIVENADSLLKVDCVRLDELSDSNKLKANIIKEAEVLFARG